MATISYGTMREIEDSLQDLIWQLEDAAKQDPRYTHELNAVMRIDKKLGEIFRRLRA